MEPQKIKKRMLRPKLVFIKGNGAAPGPMIELGKLAADWRQEKELLISAMSPFPRGHGKSFPKAIRNRAAAWIKRHAVEGSSKAKLARELNISLATVYRWNNLVRDRKNSRPTGLNTKRTLLIVILPNGIRIEGISLSEVIRLARALSKAPT